MGAFDFREGIKEDFAILALLPEGQIERRAALRPNIAERRNALIEANAKRRHLRAAAIADDVHRAGIRPWSWRHLRGEVSTRPCAACGGSKDLGSCQWRGC